MRRKQRNHYHKPWQGFEFCPHSIISVWKPRVPPPPPPTPRIMKDKWKSDLNYYKIWWTSALSWISLRIINRLRSYIKHLKECFIHFQKAQSWVVVFFKLGYVSFLKTISQCLEIKWNTLPRVWHITTLSEPPCPTPPWLRSLKLNSITKLCH